jgi:hypothetical protein
MENYELIIEAPPRRKNNWFPKGHKPFNKGVRMKDWMDGRKIKRVLKFLEIGRGRGNSGLAGANRKQIVGIKDGKIFSFRSAVDAAKILKARGVKISSRNICSVCHQKTVHVGKYSYTRKRAGGYQWFFADDTEKYLQIIVKNNPESLDNKK